MLGKKAQYVPPIFLFQTMLSEKRKKKAKKIPRRPRRFDKVMKKYGVKRKK